MWGQQRFMVPGGNGQGENMTKVSPCPVPPSGGYANGPIRSPPHETARERPTLILCGWPSWVQAGVWKDPWGENKAWIQSHSQRHKIMEVFQSPGSPNHGTLGSKNLGVTAKKRTLAHPVGFPHFTDVGRELAISGQASFLKDELLPYGRPHSL